MSAHRPNFGSDEQLVAWHRECNAALDGQESPHAVAPQCSILRADGRVLQPGEAVTVGDFEPIVTGSETIQPWAQLERAVRDGAVLVRYQRYAVQG